MTQTIPVVHEIDIFDQKYGTNGSPWTCLENLDYETIIDGNQSYANANFSVDKDNVFHLNSPDMSLADDWSSSPITIGYGAYRWAAPYHDVFDGGFWPGDQDFINALPGKIVGEYLSYNDPLSVAGGWTGYDYLRYVYDRANFTYFQADFKSSIKVKLESPFTGELTEVTAYFMEDYLVDPSVTYDTNNDVAIAAAITGRLGTDYNDGLDHNYPMQSSTDQNAQVYTPVNTLMKAHRNWGTLEFGQRALSLVVFGRNNWMVNSASIETNAGLNMYPNFYIDLTHHSTTTTTLLASGRARYQVNWEVPDIYGIANPGNARFSQRAMRSQAS